MKRSELKKYVGKYDGKRYVKDLSWWNEMVGMMFGEVSKGERVGELMVGLEGERGKEYDVGLGGEGIGKRSVGRGKEKGD